MDAILLLCRGAFASEKALADFIDGRSSEFSKTFACGDLCAVSASGDGRLSEVLGDADRIVVAACESRAVEALLRAAGVSETALAALEAVNVRGGSKCVAAPSAGISGGSDGLEILDAAPGAPSWFPVIDYSRCSSCGACADFCLFGVYATGNDGGVVVSNPGGCKDRCPACAKICPKGAIVFPKFESSPINGGDIAGDVAGRSIAAPLTDLAADDLHAALAARRAKARGKGLYKK
jgi:heterodisulfide reductase subunit A-like polyferredoxin